MTKARTSATIGELCDVVGGGTPSSTVERYWSGSIPWVSPKDMKADVIHDSVDHISEEAVASSATNLVPEGSVLVVVRSGILARTIPIARAGRELAINQDIKALVPGPRIDSAYLAYLLTARSPELLSYVSRGATVHRLMTDQLRSIAVHLPSMDEQHRIVAVLDEAFAGIAAARANAERNLGNARALFESESEAVFARAYSNGPQGVLTDLATDVTDGDHMPPPKSERGVPFVTIGNVDKRTRTLDFAAAFRVPEAYYDGLKANRKPRLGDVLYTVTGSFGIPVQVRDAEAFCFQRHIGLVRPRADVDSRWLFHLLASPQIFRQADERATGTAQRTVSLQVLRSLRVPHVPLPEQRVVAARLDSISDARSRLERVYERKLAALDELKRSLLHHAFTGQVTAPAAHLP